MNRTILVVLLAGSLVCRAPRAEASGFPEGVFGFALVLFVVLPAIPTVYDGIQLAAHERASAGWAYPQAIGGPLLTAWMVGAIAMPGQDEADAILLAPAGWYAALSGYGLASILSDQSRDAAFGAAVGAAAISITSVLLTLTGHADDRTRWSRTLRSVVQAALAVPGVLVGTFRAIDPQSPGDGPTGIALAAASGLAIAYSGVYALTF